MQEQAPRPLWCCCCRRQLDSVAGAAACPPAEALLAPPPLQSPQAGKDEKGGDPDRWKVGGPLVSDLETALRNYAHTTVRLEGSIRREAPAFIEQQGIGERGLGEEGERVRCCCCRALLSAALSAGAARCPPLGCSSALPSPLQTLPPNTSTDIMVVPDQWPQSMLQLTTGALVLGVHPAAAESGSWERRSRAQPQPAGPQHTLTRPAPAPLSALLLLCSERLGQAEPVLPLHHHPARRRRQQPHEDQQHAGRPGHRLAHRHAQVRQRAEQGRDSLLETHRRRCPSLAPTIPLRRRPPGPASPHAAA